jgi:hypothetical protein
MDDGDWEQEYWDNYSEFHPEDCWCGQIHYPHETGDVI